MSFQWDVRGFPATLDYERAFVSLQPLHHLAASAESQSHLSLSYFMSPGEARALAACLRMWLSSDQSSCWGTTYNESSFKTKDWDASDTWGWFEDADSGVAHPTGIRLSPRWQQETAVVELLILKSDIEPLAVALEKAADEAEGKSL